MKFASPYFAAVDLGSNSFHMLIVRVNGSALETIDREKEMVQIARGLQEDGNLNDEVSTRALACLRRFSERLRGIPPEQIRAVGTKTLRAAHNASRFLHLAEQELGAPIQIISGFEEARLVYSGLSHSVVNDHNERLVIDIGGGSTEFIIGKDAEPEMLESLELGCVTFSNQHFGNSRPSLDKSLKSAYLSACTELEIIRKPYLKHGWDMVYGTSGTIRAISDLLQKMGLGNGTIIFKDALTQLYSSLNNAEEISDKSIPKLRREVLPAGIAILKAIFDQLKIERLHVADATLKDGLIYDTIGRFSDEDSREETIEKFKAHYRIDLDQAERVRAMALRFWDSIKHASPNIHGTSRTKILSWAAQLHELGLSVSHTAYHQHGYYLLRHSDMAGFGRYEQVVLATLVRMHRKKIQTAHLNELDEQSQMAVFPLLMCLRLAVLLNRGREDLNAEMTLTQKHDTYYLNIDENWLRENTLINASLTKEVDVLSQIGIKLIIGLPVAP